MANCWTKKQWKEYYQKNKEKILKRCKKYRLENIEKYRARKREYYHKNRDILLPKYLLKGEIIRYGRPRKEIIELLGTKCFKCKKECIGRDLHIDHIDGHGPKSQNPNNNIDNFQILCHSCHVKKTFPKFHQWLKDQFKNNKLNVKKRKSKIIFFDKPHESCRKYHWENREKILARKRENYIKNKQLDYEKLKISKEKHRYGRSRQEILQKFNYICQKCLISFKNNSTKLHVHHIDGNGRYSSKPNNILNNLTILCISCHSKETFKEYHIWFKSQFKLGNVPIG